MVKSRRLPSPALIVATIALIIALGGTSVAAVALTRGSVTTAHLRNGAVTAPKVASNAIVSSKVKDGSLLARDFKPGTLPAGAQGPKGDPGAPGAPGAKGNPAVISLANSGGGTPAASTNSQANVFLDTPGSSGGTVRALVQFVGQPTITCDGVGGCSDEYGLFFRRDTDVNATPIANTRALVSCAVSTTCSYPIYLAALVDLPAGETGLSVGIARTNGANVSARGLSAQRNVVVMLLDQ